MKWISVKERLPTRAGLYLVFYTRDKHGRGEDGHKLVRWKLSRRKDLMGTGAGFWGNSDYFYQRITHWMPLSQPPTKEE